MKHLVIGTAFFLVSLAVATATAEVVFRWYERAILTRKPGLGSAEVDLARLGFNDASVPRRKPQGEFRVLSFGDSFALGIVRYPSTYHGVAAKLLRRATGRPVRIVNLGEGGTTFQHYIQAYRYWAPRLEHDAVIFNTFMGNDLPEAETLPPMGDLANAAIHTPMGAEPPELAKPVARVPHRYPLRMLDYLHGHLMALLHPGLARGPGSEEGLYPWAHPIPGDREAVYLIESMMTVTYSPAESRRLTTGYGQFVRLLRVMADIRTRGTPVLLVLSPSQFQVDPRFMDRVSKEKSGLDFDLPVYLAQDAVRRIDSGITVLNLVTVFRCAASHRTSLYVRDNTHWNVEGNRLAGLVIARFMASHWLGGRAPIPADPVEGSCDPPLRGRVEDRSPARLASARILLDPLLLRDAPSAGRLGTPYAELVGTPVKEIEAGGRVDAVVIPDPGWGREGRFTGRIVALPAAADGAVVGLSRGGVLEAVVRAPRTAPGACRFVARLADGGPDVEVHLVSVEEGTFHLQLFQTASVRLPDARLVRDPESGIEGVRTADGGEMQIMPGALRAMLEHAVDHGDFIDLEGIAAVAAPRLRRPDALLVFAANRLVYHGWTARERPGLAQAMGVAGTGFRFRISKRFSGDPVAAGIRVFAVVAPGVVSELPYHKGYAWGRPAGPTSIFTDDVRNAILAPAPAPAPR